MESDSEEYVDDVDDEYMGSEDEAEEVSLSLWHRPGDNDANGHNSSETSSPSPLQLSMGRELS